MASNSSMTVSAPDKVFYYEDFAGGKSFKTPGYTATRDSIIEFAKEYDPQYYHLDADKARHSVFGGLVCAGFQTASLAWGLALKTGLFEHCAVAGIGIDKLRWIRPVREGDTIHAEFRLAQGQAIDSRPGTMRAVFDYEMINQNNETVMVLSLVQILKCRPDTTHDQTS